MKRKERINRISASIKRVKYAIEQANIDNAKGDARVIPELIIDLCETIQNDADSLKSKPKKKKHKDVILTMKSPIRFVSQDKEIQQLKEENKELKLRNEELEKYNRSWYIENTELSKAASKTAETKAQILELFNNVPYMEGSGLTTNDGLDQCYRVLTSDQYQELLKLVKSL